MNTEDIYRAMGWQKCADIDPPRPYHLCLEWVRPSNWDSRLPDPLTDWSAFGEILEWAEKWTKESGLSLDIECQPEEPSWIVHIYASGVPGGVSAIERDEDFRTAVLAALSEAVRK